MICMNINFFCTPIHLYIPQNVHEYMWNIWSSMKNIISISISSIQNKLASLPDFLQLYWDIIDIMCKCKVCNIVILSMYIQQNDHPKTVS